MKTSQLKFCHGSIFFLIFIALFVSADSVQNKRQIAINVGPNHFIPRSTPVKNLGKITLSRRKAIPKHVFRTSRQGKNFQLKLNLVPGTYDLDLGFIETQFCTKSKRVFHIYINGCLLYTSPSPRDQRGSRMPSSA